MENWITRFVAALFALGGASLFWVFGVFVVVPWRTGRLLQLNLAELQVIGVSLLAGVAVSWAALHMFAFADRATHPRTYLVTRLTLFVILIAAVIGGIAWTQAHIA